MRNAAPQTPKPAYFVRNSGDGGSFRERACRMAVWNSIFDEVPYLLERWAELVSA
jgi:hypothetical protein